MTDSEIVAGIQSSNRKALEELYTKYYKTVSHFILNNSGTTDEAKEVYQETIIIFYEKVKEGSLQLSCQIGTYLYSVARRLWLRKLAGKKPLSGNVEDFEEFIEVKEEGDEYSEDNYKAMGTSLSALGEPCKGIIEDYYMAGKSMQQICDRFGYTNADNAKNQKYKCLLRLKKLFFSYRTAN